MALTPHSTALRTTVLLGIVCLIGACASGPGGVRQSEQGGDTELRLAACPSRPSCVVSGWDDPSHDVAPLHVSGSTVPVIERLEEVVKSLPRTKIVSRDANYLHATKTSRLLHYTDDIEFLINPDGRIDVRSCSRVGYYDFGVNRDRIEAIRARLN